MADIETYAVIGIIGLVMALAGWFIGRMFDTHFRAKMMRAITKRDYALLGLVGKDSKTIRFLLIDLNKDLINVKNQVWVADKQKIYRQDKPERGFFADSDSTPKKFSEGVPIIYVNPDDLKPVDFIREEGEVTPNEMGAFLLSWVNNQLAKGQNMFKQQQLLLYLVILMLLIVGFLSFKAMDAANLAGAQVATIQGQVSEMHNILLPMRKGVNGTGGG